MRARSEQEVCACIGSQFGPGGAGLAVFMSSQVLQVTPHIVGLVVLKSSQGLQATSHVVGLITLSTGTQTLSHQGSKLIHL